MQGINLYSLANEIKNYFLARTVSLAASRRWPLHRPQRTGLIIGCVTGHAYLIHSFSACWRSLLRILALGRWGLHQFAPGSMLETTVRDFYPFAFLRPLQRIRKTASEYAEKYVSARIDIRILTHAS